MKAVLRKGCGMPTPHIDEDVDPHPIPLSHDFYYEMRDGAPVLLPEHPHEP